ncbi:MAG: response regulator [Candidatus Adiutrix sp.]|jgi:chemotaxis receptor (MCP) glutamine deamidase CheD/CheY-like chemotaxis protein|nr:response regulator [Candidatus Adiutrix sp.]
MSEEINRVFLLPGEYMVSKQPHLISTLLGSCVSVCLYHPQLHFGGMNHYMLTNSPAGQRSGKYGDYAISVLLQFMERACGNLSGVEAMIFGGANVVGTIGSGEQIGERNVSLAREMLRKHSVKIVREQVGGNSGLKLHYQNWDNKIEVIPMNPSSMSGSLIARDETDRFSAVAKAAARPSSIPSTPPTPAKPSFGAAKPAAQPSAFGVGGHRIKVLIVDDSAIVRNLLSKAMADEPDLVVVGQAKDAFEAREMLLELGPDVITLDIIMPKMDGVTFLKKLMVYHPLPVIICSTIAKTGSQAEYRSDQIGAVDVIDKESLNLYNGLETVKKILIPKIRSAARTVVHKKAKEDVAHI